MSSTEKKASVLEVFLVFLRLGLTSFGGPVAHIGYFREEFVHRRGWLSDTSYADLVALCQFLPGPASSQVGMSLGLMRAGYKGAAAAWLGFTLPSAMALIVLALGVASFEGLLSGALLQGLKIAAVAVVAHAIWGMARTLCADLQRIVLMLAAAAVVLMANSVGVQVLVIAAAGGIGLMLFRPDPSNRQTDTWQVPIGRMAGGVWLGLFASGLILLPLLATLWPAQSLQLFDAFYRVGALVFGGAHVVLPLLQAEVVPNGWVDENAFLAGYGAAQAVPGPLFTFAAFLGAAMNSAPNGWLGGLLCLAAIFTPSFLLVAGALPFWQVLRRSKRMRAALMGINAAVVGLLLAAFYNPVWISAINDSGDVVLAAVALLGLWYWRLPAWAVVAGCALASIALSLI